MSIPDTWDPVNQVELQKKLELHIFLKILDVKFYWKPEPRPGIQLGNTYCFREGKNVVDNVVDELDCRLGVESEFMVRENLFCGSGIELGVCRGVLDFNYW